MSNKEPTQVYRVTLSVDVKVCGGNDKGRRITAKEYVTQLIGYPLFEGEGAEMYDIGWHGVENLSHEGKHAPYQIDASVPSYHVTSIRKVGPIEYEDNSNRWIEDD